MPAFWAALLCWPLQGFLGSLVTPPVGEPKWDPDKHFIHIWICCVLLKERLLRRDVLGSEFHSLLFVWIFV